jgi:hypothetical protein
MGGIYCSKEKEFCHRKIMIPISEIIERAPYLRIFAFLILGGISFPFPEDTTLILSGFLVAQGVIKPLRAFSVIYLDLLISDFSLYERHLLNTAQLCWADENRFAKR